MRLHNIRTLFRNPRLAARYISFACGMRSVSTPFGSRIRSFVSFSQYLATQQSAKSGLWYLPIIQSFLRCTDKRNAALVDVGANIGLHATSWSRLSQLPIYCVEPLHENALCLKQNLRLNSNNFLVIEAVAADTDGKLVFRRNVKSPQNAKIDVGTSYPCSDTVEIDSIRLDTLARDESIDSIDVLKIDTEGAEVKVLEGAQELISQNRVAIIFCEVSATQLADFNNSVAELVSLFPQNGKFLHSLDGHEPQVLERSQLAGIQNGDILYLSDRVSV